MGMPAAPIEANSAVVKGDRVPVDRGAEGHHKVGGAILDAGPPLEPNEGQRECGR